MVGFVRKITRNPVWWRLFKFLTFLYYAFFVIRTFYIVFSTSAQLGDVSMLHLLIILLVPWAVLKLMRFLRWIIEWFAEHRLSH